MKTTTFGVFLLTVSLFLFVITTHAYTSPCDLINATIPWDVLIDDDFSHPSLNHSVWNVVDTDSDEAFGEFCGQDSLCHPSNVYLEHSQLVLRTRREHRNSPTKANVTYDFSTAGVHTRDKAYIQPTNTSIARVCITSLLPVGEIKTTEDGQVIDTGLGLWPAYTMLGNKARPPTVPATFPYTCYPDDGAFTLMEHRNSENSLTSIYRWQIDSEQNPCQYPEDGEHIQSNLTNFNTSIPHEYAFEKGPTYLTTWIDGELIANWTTGGDNSSSSSITATIGNNEDSPFQINATAPWFLFINTAFGSDWSGHIDNTTTAGLFYHRIDSVRMLHYDTDSNNGGGGGGNNGHHSDNGIINFKLEIGFIVMGIFLAVAIVGFILVYLCGIVCNKRTSMEQIQYEEELLLQNQ